MPTVNLLDRALDVRPDRLDLRDRPYLPRLIGLPARYPDTRTIDEAFPAYRQDDMILNQGAEGACTGFGLAAVINYLLWTAARSRKDRMPAKVSTRMLFHLARFYDEWPGEDYQGSSCRGAMKGWHRHGVCSETHWPYHDKNGEPNFVPPGDGWEADASTRPVGAYYRIDKASVVDMQSALVEVGALYASATVHDGWGTEAMTRTSPEGLKTIAAPLDPSAGGGHAFAIVGYTADGFIVQNSWGSEWGTKGFGLLPYDDWVDHGMDAWVAAMGAVVRTLPRSVPLGDGADRSAGFWDVSRSTAGRVYQHAAYAPFDAKTAYLHSVVMGNNGIVLQRIHESEHALASLERVLFAEPLKWTAGRPLKVMIYAHGGLNGEEASVRRIRALAPYFQANGVYPIFLTWKTGPWESIAGILRDHLGKLVPPEAAGLWTRIKETAQETKDRLIESACQELYVKAIWDQMKQNASAAATEENPTLGLVVRHLSKLRGAVPGFELHLVGHSAGSILLGHLLDLLRDPAWTEGDLLSVTSCALYAPACTVKFALDHYRPAVEANLLKKTAVTFEILADGAERADTVGPYGKSLLYLVSRGLEDYHKTPLLGLANAWGQQPTDWGSGTLQAQVNRWQAFWSDGPGPMLRDATNSANDGVKNFPWAHGAFDNDVDVIRRTIERIADRPLVSPIEALEGY